MEEFIKDIFSASGFQRDDINQPVLFFGRTDAGRTEYYLVLFVKKTDLLTMESKFDEANELFQKKKKEAKDIEKNTSLIICVEFDSYLGDSPQYKNRLLQIEEDEFFYRKYIIPYTARGIDGLRQGNDVLKSINDMISNEDRFEKFNTDMFKDEPYFFAMQLFIKLPFLNLNISKSGDFVSISELLSVRIASSEAQYLKGLLETKQLAQNERDQLLQKVLDPMDSSFDDFFNTFLDDAPAS